MKGELSLVLSNGRIFKGRGFGADGEAFGEVVFTTGMTGYLETLTDPSYFGQIVTMTFPMIGNYGIIPGDFESRCSYVKGFIVKEWCAEPSNFRSEGSLDGFLKQQGIPGLCGIDTRALTKELRSAGVMNGVITPDPAGVDMDRLRGYDIGEAVSHVTGQSEGIATENPLYKVALWDFGAKANIARELRKRRCTVDFFGSNTSAEDIVASKPDGIMLSNGPGDPAINAGIIGQLKLLMKSGIPMFGICLGHQLLALANGCTTAKLKYGHRGANHPVRDMLTGQIMITSQNHGYSVEPDSIPHGATLRYTNANDGTCEGIDYSGFPAFSVQFHPEAACGPKDGGFLFDRFTDMMGGNVHAS